MKITIPMMAAVHFLCFQAYAETFVIKSLEQCLNMAIKTAGSARFPNLLSALQNHRRLKIMASSPEIVNNVSFFRRGYEEKAKELINSAISNLKKNVQGQQILMLFNIDSIFPLKESDLKPLRSLLNEYETLKKKKKTD